VAGFLAVAVVVELSNENSNELQECQDVNDMIVSIVESLSLRFSRLSNIIYSWQSVA
jgi:hypothetical protein